MVFPPRRFLTLVTMTNTPHLTTTRSRCMMGSDADRVVPLRPDVNA